MKLSPQEKAYRAYRQSIGPIKTQEDLLSSCLENRQDKAEQNSVYRGPKMKGGRHNGPMKSHEH